MISPPTGYAPVLRWKAGERAALLCTAPQLASSLTPIIEPTPNAFRHAVDRVDLFRLGLREAAKQVGLTWGRRLCFFDAHLIQTAAAPLGLNPDEVLAAEVALYGLRAAPILRLSHPAAVAKRIVLGLAPGSVVGIRVAASDIGSMIGRARVAKLLTESGVPPERAHLFVDLGVIDTDAPPTELLLGLPHLGRWAAVTVLAGSFPANLIELKPGIHMLPRLEWSMYLHLLDEWPNEHPVPGFGDYGTQHAEFQEPKSPCYPSLSVRYACEGEWIVLRGYSYRNKDAGGSRQFVAHARFLTQHPSFSGTDFCSGDQYIKERAVPGATPGSHQTWLAASMNHHISLTAANLARLAEQPLEVVSIGDYPRLAAVLQDAGFGDSPRPAGP